MHLLYKAHFRGYNLQFVVLTELPGTLLKQVANIEKLFFGIPLRSLTYPVTVSFSGVQYDRITHDRGDEIVSRAGIEAI